MPKIRNPILPGFNPDPSICRVGDDVYIATSTFEWFPGVQIHHSRDLVNWRLVTRPLTRPSQLDMRGNPDSTGVWAPCLSYADGRFWLIYTDVKRLDGNFKDSHNYLVTAPAIEGPWSDPIYLNSSGFDPSLFHDDDGRKWLLNMVWDHRHDVAAGEAHPDQRPGAGYFAGILMQEYDPAAERLVGPIRNIFAGSPRGLVEGPHLMKQDGWYLLVTAEGGTGYEHAVTHARSRRIEGPYELHPDTHVVMAEGAPEGGLQRSGHGQVVELADGTLWHTHLCSRPIPGTRRSPMGRETALQRVVRGEDGWLRLAHGGRFPASEVDGPDLPEAPVAPDPVREAFTGPALPLPFQWLRTPYPERIFSLDAAPGLLRLYGRESIGSFFEQALVARRQTAHAYSAETELTAFAPESFQQLAGLTAYYNRHQFHYLAVTAADDGGRRLTILSCPGLWPDGKLKQPLGHGLEIPADGPVRLGVDVDGAALQFRYALGDGPWQPVGPVLDASILSDEGGRGEHADFTGAFVGMAAQDLTGRARPADFAWFAYENR